MFHKTCLLLTALAAVSLAPVGSAQARDHSRHHNSYEFYPRNHHHSGGVDIGIGLGGFGYNRFNDGYFDSYADRYADEGYYAQDCGWTWVKAKKWNRTHTRFVLRSKRIWDCQ
jgi:hypothetical protein